MPRLSVSSRSSRRMYQAAVVLVCLSSAEVLAEGSSRPSGKPGAPAVSPSATGKEIRVSRSSILRLDFEEDSVLSLSKRKGNSDTLRTKLPSGRPADFAIHYEGGTPEDRFARVIPEPAHKNNQVLQYWMKHARVPEQRRGSYKGRIQLTLPNVNKTEVYERHRVYLHPDLGLYRSYPKKNTWFNISELWVGRAANPHRFRITLNLVKEKGIGKPLYFMAAGGVRIGGKPRHGKWKNVWGKVNTEFEVPVGEWMDVEVGYKQGDRNSGRYYLGVRRESDASMTTIFDITDWTYSPDAPEPIPLTMWNPLKLYTSGAIIDHIRDKGGAAQIYWDDLEIWDSWPK